MVLEVDGRGSQGRGERWRRRLEEEGLGLADLEDQADSVRYVLKRFPFLSSRKVGVVGAEYGGWLAALLLASSRTVKCGALTDPVMDTEILGTFNKHLPVSLSYTLTTVSPFVGAITVQVSQEV